MGTPQYGALDPLALIHDELIHDSTNNALREQGMDPIYTVGAAARVAVIGASPTSVRVMLPAVLPFTHTKR